jgi:hypothetical protein
LARAPTEQPRTSSEPTSLQRRLADVCPGGEQALEDYAARLASGDNIDQYDERPSQRGTTNESDDPLFRGDVRDGVPLRQKIAAQFPKVEEAINWIFQSAVSMGVHRSFYNKIRYPRTPVRNSAHGRRQALLPALRLSKRPYGAL